MMSAKDCDKSAPPPGYYEGNEDGSSYSQTTTHTTTVTQTAKLSMNKDYVKSIPGILKIIEMVLSLICFICGFMSPGSAGGWGRFVSGWVLFVSLIWFFLNLFNLIGMIHPVRVLIEWIYYLVIGIFFVIASILAAVYAKVYPASGAFAFFGFLCVVALAVDLYLQFKVWRTVGHTSTHTATTTTTGNESLVEVSY